MRPARTPISMRFPKTPRRPLTEHNNNAANKPRDPLYVFCRIRPLSSTADLSCVRVKNSTTVVLSTPEQAMQYGKQATHRETQHIFKHVFEGDATQQDVFAAVAQPLVENLLRGRNSLLFTYGVTGSGKTYTMTGDSKHRGIMPRCLDLLFRSITDVQAKKFVFKPDRLNGFEILSEEDALLERQAEMNQRFARGFAQRRKDSDTEIASQASCDMPPLTSIDEDSMYAVFITYIEVYNNSVYDLLEQGNIQKTLQSKIIREDAQHNMFVHGVTEVEIKTVHEAFEYFQMGQKRKRMEHTLLNAESSRSHSIFNIRLVQAPTDTQGEHVVQDNRSITVSQLSLVDLAGSERSARTKNTGMRLREAGNINNSLMTLRTCLEYLRENQQLSPGAAPKKVPYRDSKITHIFKNYFDGEGQVSMIVCINPRAEDYDENTQVLKFAEMTQEVQIARATPMKPLDYGMTPGRRKANKLFKTALQNLNELGYEEAKRLEVDVGLVYSLGPAFPHYTLDSPEAEVALQELEQCLIQRIEKRKLLQSDLDKRSDNFRMRLVQVEKDALSSRTDVTALQAVHKQDVERIIALEHKVRDLTNSRDLYKGKVSTLERQLEEANRKLSESGNLLHKKEEDYLKQRRKFTNKLALESDKKDRELELKLRAQRAKLHEKMRIKDEKLRLVSNILQSEEIPPLMRSRSSEELSSEGKQIPAAVDHPQVPTQPYSVRTVETGQLDSARTDFYGGSRHVRGMAAANSRHRRSRSTGERWIEHRAANPVPLGTIMQPYLKNRKSITKLTEMKDLTSHKATKYCLVSQEADTDGDVETKLYKGNVIPTCGGGAQVVFDDVECLKQKSPVPSPNRKRPNNSVGGTVISSAITPTAANTMTPQDVLSRCNVGIEGHTIKRSKF